MARVGVTVGQFALQSYNADSAGLQSYVEWFRDKMRTALNSAAGTDYKVSDIFKWAGLNANYSGWAFLVEFRAAGVPKNEQVLFVFCGFTATNWVQHTLCNNNSTTVAQHLTYAGQDTSLINAANQTVIGLVPEGGRRRSGLTVTTSDSFSIGEEVRNAADTKRGIIRAVSGAGPYTWEIEHTKGPKWAAADSITDVATGLKAATVSTEDWRDFLDIGFTDWTNLTFSGGDFTAPATSPYSDIAGFREKYASGALTETMRWKGFSAFHNNAAISTLHFIFDNTKPFLCVYTSFGRAMWIREILLTGKIYLPKDGSTTYTHGYMGQRLLNSDTAGHYTEFSINEGRYYGGGAGTAGYRATFTLAGQAGFTQVNAVNGATPKAGESHLVLYDSNEDFGTVDPDIVRTQGGYQKQFHLLTSRGGVGNNQCLKVHQSLLFPWLSTLPFMMPDYRPGYDVPPKALWRG